MTTDDGPVLAAREDGRDEAELAKAAFERVEFVIADPARVGRVRPEIVERDLLDDEGGACGRGHRVSFGLAAHAAYQARLSSSDSGRVPKAPWGHSRCISKKGRAGGVQSIAATLEVVAHERYEELLKKAGVLNEAFVDYRTRAALRTNAQGEQVVVSEIVRAATEPILAGGDGEPPFVADAESRPVVTTIDQRTIVCTTL